MNRPLFLRCPNCEQFLGIFATNKGSYHCLTCKRVYYHKDGIIDFIAPSGGDCSSPGSPDHLSSFAYKSSSEADVIDLKLRLRPLYKRVIHGAIEENLPFLDVGCGYGSLLAAASDRFDLVVGVNTDYGELHDAALWLRQRGCNNTLLVRASAQKLPFMPGQFSAVTCVQALEHVRCPEQALAELKLMLASGGGIYLSLPNRYSLRREPHTHLWGIGFLPNRVATWYASRSHRLVEFNGVNLMTTRQVSAWLRREFGTSYELIRTGYHRSTLGLLAQIAWHVPVVSFLARSLVGDIECLAWR